MEINRVGISTKGTLCLLDLLKAAKKNPEMKKSGAIASFTGIVRGYTSKGEEVQKLMIEAHPEEVIKALTRISTELCANQEIVDVFIHHFIGEFEVGEDLVYVVVIGKSRKDVFQTLRLAVERYKKEAAIWKKEYLKNGTSYWTAN
jgi:molybdopterin synthase catalytic subunit